jgi:hypothetical protein
MRYLLRGTTLAFLLAIAPVALAAEATTAIELKKELLPKMKKAQAEGKDLGTAGEEYKAGDEALKQGLQEEAFEHFKKAKAAWPADAN